MPMYHVGKVRSITIYSTSVEGDRPNYSQGEFFISVALSSYQTCLATHGFQRSVISPSLLLNTYAETRWRQRSKDITCKQVRSRQECFYMNLGTKLPLRGVEMMLERWLSFHARLVTMCYARYGEPCVLRRLWAK